MIRRFAFLFLVLFVSVCPAKTALTQEVEPKAVLYFFWGDGCPHCGHEKPFLESLKAKYPGLVVRDFEVWYNEQNKELYQKMAAAYGLGGGSVPATFIDIRSWLGYSDQKALEIEDSVRECMSANCLDPAELMQRSVAGVTENSAVDLPFLGRTDTARVSLPLLTVVLAGLDSFNPCAFFVLLMLLSFMAHAQSRIRMLVVGGVFVFCSGLVYFLFMAAWLNLFMFTGKVNLITGIAGVVALVMAAINIKDYFFFKQGVSLTLSREARESLTSRMRALISAGSMPGLLAGTLALSVMANMYELLCTAGFPMIFTRALTLQNLPVARYYLYLALYSAVYVIPLLVIVVLFATTLGSRKLSEHEGRLLKLISGLMMLALGLLLLIRPALLNNLAVSVGLLAGVVLVAVLFSRFDPARKKL